MTVVYMVWTWYESRQEESKDQNQVHALPGTPYVKVTKHKIQL